MQSFYSLIFIGYDLEIGPKECKEALTNLV